jgi:glycosyltransferase involved in cell wall biosynthesis
MSVQRQPGSMKIGFVSTMDGAAWGGSEELWCQTATRLLHEGNEVCVSLPDWGKPPAPVSALMAAGASLSFRKRKKGPAARLLDKLRKKVLKGASANRNKAWLRSERPDLVVISQGWPWEGLEWAVACGDAGVPYCLIVHANSERWWPPDSALDSIAKGYGAAKRVFFVSHENKRLAEMQCGARLPHAEVVINPSMVDAEVAVPWPIEDGITRIACVGRVDPQAKGQDLLLQVMAMPKWRERPLQVKIYGGGPCMRSVEALRKLLDLENVGFAGHVADVGAIWAENHALVLPSRYEGLPLVIVEAMLCGRPVITTDIAGNAQYIKDGENGFVAAAPAVSLLDEAMERAWSRRSEWREIGACAREDLRAVLPKDPIGVFAARLRQLAGPDATGING